jgi:hypothetical protein
MTRKRRLLSLLAVPAILFGLSPGVVHADDGSSAVWKVQIPGSGSLRNGGQTARIPLTITCPRGSSNVVVDLGVHQSIDNPAHESEGEAESVPVTCRSEAFTFWVNVQCDPTPDGDTDNDVCPYIKGDAMLTASLDRNGNGQNGFDMASANRTIPLGVEEDENGTHSFVDIRGGTVKSNGNTVAVAVSYQCPRGTDAQPNTVDIRAYVDQDLGPASEGGSGDAEGVATKTATCSGERQSTTIWVQSGLPTTNTEGSPPCEDQNTPAPIFTYDTNGDEQFIPESGGTFARGKACIQAQIAEGPSAGGDVHSAQEGVFKLSSGDS